MSVTAIDSYMHAIVLRRIADVRKRADLPKTLARLEVPFSELADLADASIHAQRKSHNSRPWVRVKASLQKRLLKETFQSYDQVATAFAIAGIEKAWTRVAAELGEDQTNIKKWLNNLVHRRNQIVHEGDLVRASRPRGLRFNKISHVDVRDNIEEVASLIDAMDKVVEE